MWYNKQNPSTIYIDIRLETRPDILCDLKHLPFRSEIFDLIVFDPPHHTCGIVSDFAWKYGRFLTREIKLLLAKGPYEFHRVLKREGILIFKWGTHDIPILKVLSFFTSNFEPLFGQKTSERTKKGSKTYWVSLRKI